MRCLNIARCEIEVEMQVGASICRKRRPICKLWQIGPRAGRHGPNWRLLLRADVGRPPCGSRPFTLEALVAAARAFGSGLAEVGPATTSPMLDLTRLSARA